MRLKRFSLFTPLHISGIDPVVIHGGFWTHNILWTKNVDGTTGDRLAAIIDWQHARLGIYRAFFCKTNFSYFSITKFMNN
jgi:hypothetical protein